MWVCHVWVEHLDLKFTTRARSSALTALKVMDQAGGGRFKRPMLHYPEAARVRTRSQVLMDELGLTGEGDKETTNVSKKGCSV